MAKVLCVLYDDPVDGYPSSYPRADLPVLERYPDGQALPTPEAIDFTPGQLLGSVSGELGLRRFLESNGHELIVTSSKDGEDSVFERELPDADVVISQPFWPAYLTAERIAKAKKLKLVITAGIARKPGMSRDDLLRSRGPGRRDNAWAHRGRGDVLQQCQRLRARRHDDPHAGAQLPPVLPAGTRGRLEHRRLCSALL